MTAPEFDLPYVEPQGNVLYDNYLGTGGGLSELGVVYDEAYSVDEYELLAALYDEDRVDENVMVVIAQPDEDGVYAQHSLILSGLQLARLWQDKQIQWIELRNGDASAMLPLVELVSGNVAKLIHMFAYGEPDVALNDLETLPEVELSAEELAYVSVELRIVPPKSAQDGYRMDVYLRAGDEQLCITELLTSFNVGLTADELADDAAREDYSRIFALCATQEDGTIVVLPSVLLRVPMEVPQDEMDTADFFAVSFENEDRNAVVLYDLAADADMYRRYALYAAWPGDMAVSIVKSEN